MAMDYISGKKFFLKLVHPGGIVETHHQPITTGEVMKKYPRHFVTRPDIFKFPWLVVRPESILQPGNKFYVVPEHTLRRLLKSKGSQNQKQPNCDVKLKGKCKVKSLDRGSFRHRDSKVIDYPDEFFYKQPYFSESSVEMPYRTAPCKGNLKIVHPISHQSEAKTSIKRFPIRNIDGKPCGKPGLAKKREGESDRPEKPCSGLPILDQFSDSSSSNSDYLFKPSCGETKFNCYVKRRSQACRNRESCKLCDTENIPPPYALGHHSEEVLSRKQHCGQSTREKSSLNGTSSTRTVTENDRLDKQHPCNTGLPGSTNCTAGYAKIPYQPSPEMNNFGCIIRKPSNSKKNSRETKLKDSHTKFRESKHYLVNKQCYDQSTCTKLTIDSLYQAQDIGGNKLQYDAWGRNRDCRQDTRGDAKSHDHSPENDHEMMSTQENVVQLKSCLRKDKSRLRRLRVRFTLPGEDKNSLRVRVFEYEDLGSPQLSDNLSFAPEFFDISNQLCTPGNVLRH